MYKYSIYDPLIPKVKETGDIKKDQAWNLFENFPWKEYNDKMENAGHEDFYYSPTLEIENKEKSITIEISLLSMDPEFDFYISYKRPKMVSKLFGLMKQIDKKYLSYKNNQSEKDAHDAVKAFLNNDMKTLEERWG